ncbi:hypothetical protein [Georgenia yuyongxinii]
MGPVQGIDVDDRVPLRSPGPSELLGAVRAAVRRLTAGAPSSGLGWGHAEREDVIAGLDGAIQALTLYRGQLLVAHKEDGRWGTALDRDFADWRGRASGTGRGPAVGELQVAEGLHAMPEVADAVAGGELTLEHARALTRLRATGSAEVKAALEGGAAADLVAKGKRLSAPGWPGRRRSSRPRSMRRPPRTASRRCGGAGR